MTEAEQVCGDQGPEQSHAQPRKKLNVGTKKKQTQQSRLLSQTTGN